MSLLENHLEQISLSSSAISDLPYGFHVSLSPMFPLLIEIDLQVSPATDLYELVAEYS